MSEEDELMVTIKGYNQSFTQPNYKNKQEPTLVRKQVAFKEKNKQIVGLPYRGRSKKYKLRKQKKSSVSIWKIKNRQLTKQKLKTLKIKKKLQELKMFLVTDRLRPRIKKDIKYYLRQRRQILSKFKQIYYIQKKVQQIEQIISRKKQAKHQSPYKPKMVDLNIKKNIFSGAKDDEIFEQK